jgi:hypothetical protein
MPPLARRQVVEMGKWLGSDSFRQGRSNHRHARQSRRAGRNISGRNHIGLNSSIGVLSKLGVIDVAQRRLLVLSEAGGAVAVAAVGSAGWRTAEPLPVSFRKSSVAASS